VAGCCPGSIELQIGRGWVSNPPYRGGAKLVCVGHCWHGIRCWRTALSTENELASVGALSCSPLLILLFILVRVVELDTHDGCAPSRIVDQLPDHSSDVAIPFSKVQRSQTAGSLAMLIVRFENGTTALTLTTDLTTLRLEGGEGGV